MYEFTKDLETGNAMIDSQHKQLIQLINQLLDACAQGKGRSMTGNALKFLNDYTIRHFNDEEQIQKSSGYPGYAQHKTYHEGFKKVVADIVTEFEQTGPTVVLVGKVNNSIAGWLLNHIKREDKKVADYVKKANI